MVKSCFGAKSFCKRPGPQQDTKFKFTNFIYFRNFIRRKKNVFILKFEGFHPLSLLSKNEKD